MKTASPERQQQHLPTKEHVLGRALDKLLEHAWPLIPWILLRPAAAILYGNWHGGWAPLFTGFCGVVVTALSVKLTGTRGWATRILTPVTVACAFGWLTAADTAGVSHRLAGIWFIGGGTIAVAWCLHMNTHASGSGGIALGLEEAHAAAGQHGIKVLAMKILPRKKEGVMRLPGGKLLPKDVSEATGYVESAAGLPPGSLVVRDHEDNAQLARFTLTDPRVLKKGHDWPGPSRPGQSIAEPIRPGLWQDGEPVEYVVVGHHLQVMGMTGAGKSTGQGWNEIAETITRYDAAVLGVDYTKGSQFLGPFTVALHALITDPEQGEEFWRDVHNLTKARTEWLGDHGHTKWVQGCGLTHLTFQQEEVPDIYAALDKSDDDDLADGWMSDIKAKRSAGERDVLSLQRADFSQIPTLARGQMGKQCFGVESDDDADFGLSAYQKARDCKPEIWGVTYPGMCLLDAPTIDQKYKAMPMRCWYWGEKTGPGSLPAVHAAQYPAAARPLDPLTYSFLGKYLPAAAAAVTADPMPGCPGIPKARAASLDERRREVVHLVTAKPAEPAQGGEPVRSFTDFWTSNNNDDGDDASLEDEWGDDDAPLPDQVEYDDDGLAAEFEGGGDEDTVKLPADQAQAAFLGCLEKLAGAKERIDIGDLIHLADDTGHSRSWVYYMAKKAETAGILRAVKDGDNGLGGWVFTRPAARHVSVLTT